MRIFRRLLKNPIEPLTSNITLNRVEVTDDAGSKLIKNASFRMNIKEQIAAVGVINSGAQTIAEVLARLTAATSGSVLIGDKNIDDLSEAITGRRFAYVGT